MHNIILTVPRDRMLLSIVLVVVLCFLVSCSGFVTQDEKNARKQLNDIVGVYLDDLSEPNITSETSLSELVTYAIKRSPQVKSAYYDWVGAVRKITVERSLPEPRVMFGLDVQDVIMGVMPGLMLDS